MRISLSSQTKSYKITILQDTSCQVSFALMLEIKTLSAVKASCMCIYKCLVLQVTQQTILFFTVFYRFKTKKHQVSHTTKYAEKSQLFFYMATSFTSLNTTLLPPVYQKTSPKVRFHGLANVQAIRLAHSIELFMKQSTAS